MPAEAFDRLLSKNIGRIARAFESAQFSRIGVKIAIPDLVSDSEQGDIWTRALTSLREGGLESWAGFSLGELLQFLKHIGTRLEYTLSGIVTFTPQEATAWAQLASLKNGQVIATWQASSRDYSEIVASVAPIPGERPKAMLRTSKGRFTVNMTMETDARENIIFLSDLADVLACKIWHQLAQGARSEMRPSSWQTVYFFVYALNILAGSEMKTGTDRETAIENLQLVSALDPLYKPAGFFLAYASLLEGDVQHATQMFDEISVPVNKEADSIFKAVQEKWVQTGPRWLGLIKTIKPSDAFCCLG